MVTQACRNCGSPFDTQRKFCKNCGHLNNEVIVEHSSIKKVFSTKTFTLTIVSVLCLSIILYLTHTFLTNKYKPEKTITNFEQMVMENDYKGLKQILAQGKTEAALSDKALYGFIKFLKEDNKIQDISSGLTKSAQGIKSYKKLNYVEDENNNKIVKLVKGKKKFGLYQQYHIKAYPFTIEVYSDVEKTQLSLDGKKMEELASKNNPVTLKKVLPGEHHLNGTYKTDYLTLKKDKTIDFSDSYENQITVNLELGGGYLEIYSNHYDGEIYVDGKKTGLKIKDIDEFGPIPTDRSIELHAVLKTEKGLLNSNKVKVKNDETVYLEFPGIYADGEGPEESDSYESIDEYIYNFLDNYLNDSVYAINTGDFYEVSEYLSFSGNHYDLQRDTVLDYYSRGITEELVDFKIINIEENSSGALVTIEDEYNIHFEDGTKKNKAFKTTFQIYMGEGDTIAIESLISTNELSSKAI